MQQKQNRVLYKEQMVIGFKKNFSMPVELQTTNIQAHLIPYIEAVV